MQIDCDFAYDTELNTCVLSRLLHLRKVTYLPENVIIADTSLVVSVSNWRPKNIRDFISMKLSGLPRLTYCLDGVMVST